MLSTSNTNKIHKDIYYTQIIDHVEGISNLDLKNKDIDSILLEKSKNSLGDKCSKNGFILKDSIKLLQRTIGRIKSSHFNGMIIFNIKLEVKICSPSEGDIIECVVFGKNKMGILAKKFPLIIALSQLHHDDKTLFDKVQINQKISVQVIDTKFSLNDNEIQVIGKIYNL